MKLPRGVPRLCFVNQLGHQSTPCTMNVRYFAPRNRWTTADWYAGLSYQASASSKVGNSRITTPAAAAEPLMAVMPPLVHVRLDEARAHLLQTTLQLIGLETAEDGLGSSLVIGRLHDVLFVQAVRAWCTTGPQAGGWLAGLKDDRLALSIRAMHGDLARGWTVETLAREAGLSRSTFAAT